MTASSVKTKSCSHSGAEASQLLSSGKQIRDEMIARFSVPQDGSGAANYTAVTDPVHQEILEIIVSAITSNLYRTDEEIFGITEEERRLYREDVIRRARESLVEAYGQEEFERRFGGGFDDPET